MTPAASSTTSPSSLDRSYAALLTLYRNQSPSDVGAGQRATRVHGIELMRLDARWGLALFDDEPVSRVVASLQREITALSERLHLWYDHEPHPSALRHVEELEFYRREAWDLMETYLAVEVPGTYSQAPTADDYERLMMPLPAEARPRIDYKALRDQIDLVDYIARYGPVRRAGANFSATCPMHDDRHPSLRIYPQSKRWWCFVCDKGGDVIDYARLRSGALPTTA